MLLVPPCLRGWPGTTPPASPCATRTCPRWDHSSAAIGGYRAQPAVPGIETLIVDAAHQVVGVTDDPQVCWSQEGRHYTKLPPFLPLHRALLDAALAAFWTFSRDLQAYPHAPSAPAAASLRTACAAIFTCQTGYGDLDDRLAQTSAPTRALLRVLATPYVPLQTNPADLAARQHVRKRDVSFGARAPAGMRAWTACRRFSAPPASGASTCCTTCATAAAALTNCPP